MMDKMSYKYAVVYVGDCLRIQVSDKPMSYNIASDHGLKNVEIISLGNGTIRIKGEESVWEFSFNRLYVADMAKRPSEKWIKRTMLFKQEYVHGWYETGEKTIYEVESNKYIIEYL